MTKLTDLFVTKKLKFEVDEKLEHEDSCPILYRPPLFLYGFFRIFYLKIIFYKYKWFQKGL